MLTKIDYVVYIEFFWWRFVSKEQANNQTVKKAGSTITDDEILKEEHNLTHTFCKLE